MNYLLKYFIIFFICFSIIGSALANNPDISVLSKIKVIKISEADQAAVLRIGQGLARLVKVGESLDTIGVIRSISKGRLVVEEPNSQGRSFFIIRLENGKQNIEYIKRESVSELFKNAPEK